MEYRNPGGADYKSLSLEGVRSYDLEVLCAVAKDRLEQGQVDLSQEALEEALRIEPDFAPALELLSLVYTLKEDLGRSLSCLERLVALKPDDLHHRRALARLYLMGERYDDVIETLEKEVGRRKFMLMGKGDLDRNLTAEDLLALAASYLKSRRFQEAISLLKSLESPPRQKEIDATNEIGLREVLDRLLCLVEGPENPFLSYVYQAFPFAKKLRLALPLLYDLDLLLEDIRDRPPRKAEGKVLSGARRETINRKLALREAPDGSLPRFRFLETLLLEANFLHNGPQGVSLTLQGKEYLRSAPRDQFRLILDAWLRGRRWDELFEIEGLKLCRGGDHCPYGQEKDAQRNLRERREVVLKHLQDFDLGKLYPLETLWEKIAFHHPYFLRQKEDLSGPQAWRICRKRPGEEPASWEELEGRLIESLLRGPLSWLDLAGIIQRDDGRVTHFFLKPLIYFGLRPTGGIGKALFLKGKLEIQVDLSYVDRFDLREIERFSELKVGYRETNLYRITTRSVEEGLKKSISLGNFLECLERIHGAAMPPATRQGILGLVTQD